ncbi:MAG: hypothetical protein HUJ18_00745 [Marinobacter sp.]|nr:hypothetical protein [Marinobacter sp.]
MKKSLILLSTITFSVSVLAGNAPNDKDMNHIDNQIKEKHSAKNILQNRDMQRLHRDMTLSGMSEPGMEARLKMMTTEEGRAYHKALEKRQKNTAG